MSGKENMVPLLKRNVPTERIESLESVHHLPISSAAEIPCTLCQRAVSIHIVVFRANAAPAVGPFKTPFGTL